MNRFKDKVAVITGAAGGIGEATTRRIVSEGGKVVIADRCGEKAEQLASELAQSGADVRPVYFSATELQSCKQLINFAVKEYGQVDILINRFFQLVAIQEDQFARENDQTFRLVTVECFKTMIQQLSQLARIR